MEQPKKPRCRGCNTVGEDDFYYWRADGLWHYACLTYTYTFHLDPKRSKEVQDNMKIFITRLIDNNPKLQAALRVKDVKPFQDLFNKVLAKRKMNDEKARLFIERYTGLKL